VWVRHFKIKIRRIWGLRGHLKFVYGFIHAFYCFLKKEKAFKVLKAEVPVKGRGIPQGA
jgi:hypothetical protein